MPSCAKCTQNFVIDDRDHAFYEKMKVPPSTFCPECRLQRRLAWRNERALYPAKCSMCQKPMISRQPPESKLTTYCNPCWWSDKWDPTSFGRAYDFSKPFFQQFSELLNTVPGVSLTLGHLTNVNSDYNNMAGYLKNCYMLFNSDYDEDCLYGAEVENSKSCVDATMIDGCELCHQCVNCAKCYQTHYSVDCNNCTDVWLSKNLSGCSDCFGCVNLRNKSHHIFNEPYSSEEYKAKLAEFGLASANSLEKATKKAHEFWDKFPNRYMHGFNNESQRLAGLGF